MSVSIITIVIVLVLVGIVLWLINTYIPMAGAIKAILNIFVIIVVVWWLLSIFGLVPPIQGLKLK